MNRKRDPLAAFDRLLALMNDLREKCPWDKKQTMQTLRPLTVEETYELTAAVLDNNMREVKNELGDLLLHIVFYAKIASETDEFDIADVIHDLCEKLITRHPHIYGNVKAETEEEVKQNWEQIKRKEGSKSVLAGVPKTLPAVIKAIRIQEKARAAGFDWEKKEQVWEKVEEELREFREEFNIESNEKVNADRAEREFGDLLFSLINYSRFIGINPEDALEKTNNKFIKRFRYLEEQSEKDGKSLKNMSLAEMDMYWEEAKKI